MRDVMGPVSGRAPPDPVPPPRTIRSCVRTAPRAKIVRGGGRSLRTEEGMVMRPALFAIPVVALAATLTGCGGDSGTADEPSTSTATTSTAPHPPTVTGFSGPPEVACRGAETTAAATWTTRNADVVSFSVDDEPLSAAAGYPTSGAGDIPLPCDDGRHVVTLTAEGDGGDASESVVVMTVRRAPRPRPRPAVLTLTAPASAECTNAGAAVPVEWTTRNATSVELSVDGEPLSADAGEPVDGGATVPLPCDRRAHRITLTAYGIGSSTATYAVRVATVPEQPAGRPAITRFSVPAELRCGGAQASVPASWTTSDAAAVSLSVDGRPVPAGAGYPVSGTGGVPVPCDTREHTLVLTATSASGTTRARHSATVNTVPRRAPAVRPAVTRLAMPTRVGCPAGAVDTDVAVAWRTRGAQAVQFVLDGEPVPAQAGLPINGAGNLPVPCDGTTHMFTLVASGTGTSTGRVQRPITAEPAAGASATTPATVTTTGG